ncbi:MAG: Rieske (2Fe-2S) protein [Cyclobacteriaceae bacterium]|nr:Rieske (2Fe-2S) protein [Cyclobacteriaceae bacterium HetDA_MAG_MS6]
MKRRIFIEKTGQLLAASGLGFSLIGCSEDDPGPNLGAGLEIDLETSPFDALQTSGSWILHPNENVIIVNFDGEIRAFTSVCTHSQCSRNWVFGATQATCTCHGSKFNYKGEVVAGPAQRDLRNFTVSQDGSVLIVK